MRTALLFLVLVSAATAANTLPVYIGNDTDDFMRAYHNWDDLDSYTLIPPHQTATVYFRRGGLSNFLTVTVVSSNQLVMARDVVVAESSANSSYAYVIYETGTGTYSSSQTFSYGEANDLNDPTHYGYAVFLAGLVLAATVRLTRVGLRWVRAVGDDGHETL